MVWKGAVETSSIDDYWKSIKDNIRLNADQIIGHILPRKRNDWFDDECKTALDNKNEAYKNYLQRPTRAKRQIYEDLRRTANKLCRHKKRRILNDKLIELDDNFKSKNIRNAFKIAKSIKTGYVAKTNLVKDETGQILSNSDKIKTRWQEYFQQLLNPTNMDYQEVERESNTSENEIDEPSYDEIEAAIKALKNNKACGVDEIPAELLKKGGPCIVYHLWQLIKKIWYEEKIPDEWTMSVIIPIHKKGDKLVCNNYRGISLLCVAYKVLSKFLESRIRPLAEKLIGEYQGGFRQSRSTTDQLFVVKQILEKCWEYNVDVHQIFVDFKQAYDSVDRVKLLNGLDELGIPTKLIRLIKATMDKSASKVRVGKEATDIFQTQSGLRQGDGLAPVLFNLSLELVIRKLKIVTNSTLLTKSTQLVAYADDINIIARTEPDARQIFLELDNAAREMGLSINENKTKYMITTRKNRPTRQNKTFGDFNIENVTDFTYLGASLSNTNDEGREIQTRIMAANRTYFSLTPILTNRKVHRLSKIRLYKTTIRPVLSFGCETWTLTKKLEETIDIFERKILRRIYGPTQDANGWRIRYNHELYSLYDDIRASDYIKYLKLQWAGHVNRMNDERIPKKTFVGRASGQRPVGKPRRRWADSVDEASIALLGAEDWRTKSLDRENFKRQTLEAKARLGLSRR